MSRRRFFVDRFTDGTAILSRDAAHHLAVVLRAEPGATCELSDGREVYLARLERLSRDAAHFALIERLPAEPPTVEPALLIAVVKFDRFEWALEKAAELGAGLIVPLAAERSGKALVAAAAKRAARWRRILDESAQQARRLRPPLLGDLATPAEAFRAALPLTLSAARILLSERPGAPPLAAVLEEVVALGEATPLVNTTTDALGESSRAPLANAASDALEAAAATPLAGAESDDDRRQVSLAVGPEGGWTDAEFAAAEAAGFREAALGRNILRTETAVVAGLAAAQLFWAAQYERDLGHSDERAPDRSAHARF